jgi:Mg2+ and Co2+ transporter CorA
MNDLVKRLREVSDQICKDTLHRHVNVDEYLDEAADMIEQLEKERNDFQDQAISLKIERNLMREQLDAITKERDLALAALDAKFVLHLETEKTGMREQLAASQAREQVLREAIAEELRELATVLGQCPSGCDNELRQRVDELRQRAETLMGWLK